jgi:hypothetical protein
MAFDAPGFTLAVALLAAVLLTGEPDAFLPAFVFDLVIAGVSEPSAGEADDEHDENEYVYH